MGELLGTHCISWLCKKIAVGLTPYIAYPNCHFGLGCWLSLLSNAIRSVGLQLPEAHVPAKVAGVPGLSSELQALHCYSWFFHLVWYSSQYLYFSVFYSHARPSTAQEDKLQRRWFRVQDWFSVLWLGALRLKCNASGIEFTDSVV